jgi:lipopolysaccharide biosynthesis protein
MSADHTSPKIIAQYFPQLHRIAENDQWWGEGFTDWVNVRKATPLFRGHYQPRIPWNGDHYDQAQETVVRRQVDLANQYGVHGFCHYHYWFDGKQLLETPTEIFLRNKDIKLKFCLAWANETWSRRWDGQDHHILVAQTHPPDKERWELHFQYLVRAWTDERAIQIDGKPIFLIYRPYKIEKLPDMLDYFQHRAHQCGLRGIYFVVMNQYGFPDAQMQALFDAVMMFQPFVSMFALRDEKYKKSFRYRSVADAKTRLLRSFREPRRTQVADQLGPTIENYDEVWRDIITRIHPSAKPIFPGGFVDWDNTARYNRRATIFAGATPEKFEFWMRRLLGAVTVNRPEERLVFINAWNEWAEGAHLEPDNRNGYLYLDAIRKAVGHQTESVEQSR